MSLENLQMRLRYHGGNTEGRMISDKLRSLKKALFRSYQAATAILSDGREFKCLINSDKNKPDYDTKIISIPFEDIRLNAEMPPSETTTQGIEPIGMKPGDTFTWKETNTHWLVYLQYLEEDAYFRAEIRRCDNEIEINGNKYWVYLRGPVETTIQWNQKKNVIWNNLNYSTVLYVPKNEETLTFFKRFQKVKLNGNTWQVEAVNAHYADGIILVNLGEYHNNSIEDENLQKTETPVEQPTQGARIEGPLEVYPYDIVTYIAKDSSFNGKWSAEPDVIKVKSLSEDGLIAEIEITASKSGDFILSYNSYLEEVKLPIKIKSL